MSGDYQLDDEWEYAGYRIGRPTRTVEVDAPGDATATIKEGTITADLATAEELRETRHDAGWTAHFVGPDGGVGFKGGVTVHYDLAEIVEFPEPMTEKEADEWLDDEVLLKHRDDSIESDLTAEDVLEELR